MYRLNDSQSHTFAQRTYLHNVNSSKPDHYIYILQEYMHIIHYIENNHFFLHFTISLELTLHESEIIHLQQSVHVYYNKAGSYTAYSIMEGELQPDTQNPTNYVILLYKG